MSTEIDERVVEMDFDNRKFERGVSQSLGTLGKLRRALKLDGAADGLEAVDEAANGVDLSPLVSAAEAVSAKFSALEVIGITALSNITNSAINTGKQLVKSLTVDQISAGFDKFTDKTTSVATLVSQGYELKDVNEQLSRLNWFTDETSYNFTDMVANIAKFTATGQDLNTSVTAMEGIANWAALSGQNAATASRAMYQISQAMGAGVMRKEDYQSIQNASMDTEEFRQKCLDAGVALGTLKKNADDTYTSLISDKGAFTKSQFVEHLTQDAWMTSDVMMKVFGDYSAAVDQIYEYADEKSITASKAIEELGDNVDKFGLKAFKAAQEARSWGDAVDSVKDAVSTGWMTSFELIFGDQKEATVLWTDLANAMYDAFAAGGEVRNELLEGWDALGGRTRLIEAFWNVWNGVASIIEPIKKAFHDIFPPATVGTLMDITVALRKFTSYLILTEEQADKVRTIFRGIFSVLGVLVKLVKTAASVVFSVLKSLSGLGAVLLNAAAAIGDMLTAVHKAVTQNDIFAQILEKVTGALSVVSEKVRAFAAALNERLNTANFEALGNIFGTLFGLVVKLGGALVSLGKQVGGALSKAFNTGGIKGVIDIVNGGIFAGILLNMRKFTKGFTDAFGGVKDILGGVTGILDGVKGCLQGWQEQLKAGTLMKIAQAVGILSVSLLLLASIDQERLTSALAGLSVLFVELMGSLAAFNKMNVKMAGTVKAVAVMNGMAVAVLILSAAMKNLASLDWNGIAKGLTGVAVLMTELIFAAKGLSTIKGRAVKGAAGLVILAAALKIMASVCADLARLSWEELAKGLAGIAVLLAELDIFLNTAKFGKRAFSTSAGMVVLAAALKIMASVCADLAKLSWGDLGKGLAGIAGLLAEITLFVNLTGKAKHVISTGIALAAIGGALKIFASVCTDLAKLSWEGIAKGLSGIAGALAAVTIAVRLMPKNLIGIGAGLVIVGAAVAILADSLMKIGGMSWEGITKGLVAVGGSLLIFAAALNMMKRTAAGSASLLIAAGALALLVPELKALGKMSAGQVGTGLLTLAGAFTVIGLSALLLKPLVGTIIKLSAAVALFGVGCVLAGAGILALSAGITALSASLMVAAGSLGEIIVVICTSITSSADSIAEALTALVRAVCKSISETIPVLAETFTTVALQVLSSLRDNLPQMVDLVFDILSELLDKLEIKLPALAQKAVKMIKTLFDAIDSALGDGGLEELMVTIAAVAGVFLAIAAAAKLISSIDIKGALKGIAGFAIAVGGMTAVLIVLGALGQIPGVSWLIDEGGKIFTKLGKAIGAFAGSLITAFLEAMPDDISGVVGAIANIGLIIAAFKPMMTALEGVDFKTALTVVGVAAAAVVGLVALLAALGGLAQIPGLMWIVGEGAKLLCAIGDTIGGFVGSIINGMAKALTVDISQVINALLSVVGVVAAVAECSKVIENVKLAGMAEGILGIAIAILGMTAILAALGGLAMIPGFDEIMSGGADILLDLGSILGKFVGNIIGGIGQGITGSLPQMGNDLSLFMTNITPFIEGIRSIDSAVLYGVLALSGAILALTGAELIQGIASFLGGGMSIADFGKDIAAFGPCLVEFSDSVAGINGENVKNAADAARALAEMTACIPNEGGVASWFAGENSISKFGNDIVSLGLGLASFSEVTADISPENIIAASEAGKALCDMTSTIPNEGGVASWFAGENSISKFGNDIVSLGLGLASFSEVTADISPENIIAASEAGKALCDMTNMVPSTNGVAQWFAGEKSLSKFGAEIADFGGRLKEFSDNAAGIDPEKVSTAVEAGKIFAGLTDVIPNANGVAQWFAGEKSLVHFGGDIAGFGASLSEFSANVRDIDTDRVKAAVEAGEIMASLTDVVPNEGGIKAWFVGENSLASFGSQIASFGTSIQAFSDNVTGLDIPAVTAAADAGKNLADMTAVIPQAVDISAFMEAASGAAGASADFAGTLSGVDMDMPIRSVRKLIYFNRDIQKENYTGFSALSQSLKQTASDGVDGFVQTFNGDDAVRRIQTAMQAMMRKAGNAARNAGDLLVSALSDTFGRAVEAAYNSADKFRTAGKNIVGGIAEGIRVYIPEAEKAAREMASAAAEAARDELDIHSPSRVFNKIGRFTGEGFVTALSGYADISWSAGEDIGSSAMGGISAAVGKISDIINGDIDPSPVITPVLDLSELQGNAGKIDALLSRKQAMTIDAGISVTRERQQADISAQGSSRSFSFTQNITAPKSLDAKTIYRQTHNQFSRMMEVIR